ncbi:MAG: glycosyltransferase family 2 protein [Chitinophaga sp.]|uniref:glycosyltransferase family 2 protein n=1 Tax=Chitinophaga sp. TaxID=1869181 RepID=UPI001B0548A0|nr:glycosyltransferase family 2 protein [Chitinophaga sp.]MBO9728342.1 glycosyltransferase family 2 protein [Chitinophaga sp.]
MEFLASAPLVSVIIPTYNRAHSLGKAIESVLNQTYSNIQLIVVDDGSDDGTSEFVKQYEEVQFVLQVHGGQGRARNTGLKYAKGVYIASLDSDDVWAPTFLEKTVTKLEQDQLDFVFVNWLQAIDEEFGADFFAESKILDHITGSSNNGWIDLSYDTVRKLYTNVCPSPSSSFIMRRTSMQSGWNEQLHIADDWCLLLDIILSGHCKVSFTFERLWIKKRDGRNIYDGRDALQIIQLLWKKDYKVIMMLFRDLLTAEELKNFHRVQVSQLYSYSLISFKRFLFTKESIHTFWTAVNGSPYMLIHILSAVTKNKVNNIIRRLKGSSIMQHRIPLPVYHEIKKSEVA